MDIRIELRNTEMLEEWDEKIGEEVSRLESHHPYIVHHLRLTIIATAHHRLGAFEIRAVSSVPDDTIVVKKNGELVVPLIVEVFDDLDRRLREYSRQRQHLTRQEIPCAIGIVYRVVPDSDYGFIQSADGREIYFHKNSLKNVSYKDLHEGDSVEFCEEDGTKGPQATWVRLKRRRVS
jgi:cold shock CspA family protein/ribosome-associated translation inhibitor RaiA